MEDIIKALLDVVRAQHSASEGTEEAPFNMDDIVDMAMNIFGRPEEPEEETGLIDSIQKMIETFAPDIFPPKTFEEMDDSEKAASAVNMIEERLKRGFRGMTQPGGDRTKTKGQSAENTQAPQNMQQEKPGDQAGQGSQETEVRRTAGQNQVVQESSQEASQSQPEKTGQTAGQSQTGQERKQAAAQTGENIGQEIRRPGEGNRDISGMHPQNNAEYEEALSGMNEKETADLNDLIYKNFMQMMGLQNPQVEYPFDRSQIKYGREKSITEQLAEEEAAVKPAESQPKKRPLSAWELAQNAINKEEEAKQEEPVIPEPSVMPNTKSASQLAAEAIARAQEEDRIKLEAEKKAERLMEEAKKRGQDPMAFALHQQEILQYMEKNSDELVSFEDFEDLSPEEKLEIERQIHIEKQLAAGVRPEEVNREVPEQYIPQELIDAKAQTASVERKNAASAPQTMDAQSRPAFTEEMLRQLSREVVSENADMILSEDAGADMENLNQAIFENIRRMMSGSGAPVNQEDVGSLISQVITSQTAAPKEPSAKEVPDVTLTQPQREEEPVGMSAVELAKAAQKKAVPEPKVVKEGKSAVELAKEAQALARSLKEAQKTEKEEELSDADFEFDELDQMEEEPEKIQTDAILAEDFPNRTAEKEGIVEENEETEKTEEIEKNNLEEKLSESTQSDFVAQLDSEESEKTVPEETAPEETEEYEYVDPAELVLGEHTQAEIDEAMENLASLGLEGEVFERAKRMLLLELAGSEAALDAWLYEQENGKKKKAAVSALDDEADSVEDLSELDEDALEKELEIAMDEEFLEEELETENTEEKPEVSDVADTEKQPETSEPAAKSFDGENETEDITGKSAENSFTLEKDSFQSEEEKTKNSTSQDIQDDKKETKAEVETAEVEVESTENMTQSRMRDSMRGARKERGTSSSFQRRSHSRRNVVKKKEKTEEKVQERKEIPENPVAQEKGYQVSVRNPFVLKNSASFMDHFEEFIVDTQENRKLSTGFYRLDAMLRYGLHKGSYFIDSNPQYLKNAFMQQIADRAAESGVDVLYISTELSRYDLMVETISRLSYEMNEKDSQKAVSAMSIMTGDPGADLSSLKDELNWYRGRISEHLFILDQEAVEEYVEAMEDASAGDILAELIRSIVREGAHKPVVFIDNIENILSFEDSQDMKPLMDGIKVLAKELGIPILMSYGYAQAESEEELYGEEEDFHRSLGNMCDVYLELKYADMITEDMVPLTQEDVYDMMEDGETLLIDVALHRNRKAMRASCQIQGTPRYNYFEE